MYLAPGTHDNWAFKYYDGSLNILVSKSMHMHDLNIIIQKEIEYFAD